MMPKGPSRAVIALSALVTAFAFGPTEPKSSDFARLCKGSEPIEPTQLSDLDADLSSFTARGGAATVHYAHAKQATPASCVIIVLEFRGFGLAKHRGADKFGMKVATLASDYNELILHLLRSSSFSVAEPDVFLVGISGGSNVIWAWMQSFYTPLLNVKGIMPMGGGLASCFVPPQARAAAASFTSVAVPFFTTADVEEITNNFLTATTDEKCFEQTYGFFTAPGFFSSPLLADTYISSLCEMDCVAFALLNKDSLLADYTDAVVENVLVHRVPVFVYTPDDGVLPESTMTWVAEHSLAIPLSVEFKLAGGKHFTLMPEEPGSASLTEALAAFVSDLVGARRLDA